MRQPVLDRPSSLVLASVTALTASLVFLCAPVTAQQRTVSLPEAIEMFNRNNLELRSSRARADEMLGLARQAAAFPNPSLVVSHEPVWRDGRSYDESYLNVTQRIEWPGLRTARVEAADGIADAALADVESDSVRLAYEVARLYARAASAGQRRDVLQSTAEIFRIADEAHVQMVSEGDASTYRMLRTRIERARYEQQLAAAALAHRDALRQLEVLIAPENTELNLAGVEALPPVPEAIANGEALASALRQRAGLRAARARVAAAEASAVATQRARLPSPSVTAGFKRQSDGFEGLFVGTSIPLPVFDRNVGNIQAQRARVTAAESRRALLESTVRRDVQSAYEAYRSAMERTRLISEELLGESDALLRAAQVGYDEGEISLAELLDATEAFTDARLTRIDLDVELHVAYYDLLRAAGGRIGANHFAAAE